MAGIDATNAGAKPKREGASESPHLDALRILAAVAIVILHYSNYVEDTPAGRFIVTHSWHFNLFVDLFFVISGFVIAAQYSGRVADRHSIGRFLWRRLARIYPLHIATLAFYLAIALLLYFGYVRVDNPERYPLSDLPNQVLLLHAVDGQRLTFNFPSWSLSAEMLCYLLFPLVALVGLRRPMLVVGLALAVVAIMTLYVTLSGAPPWPEWINKGGAVRALPAFFLGVSLFLFRDRIAGMPMAAVLLPALLAFVVVGWALPDMAAIGLIYLVAIAAVHCDVAMARTVLSRLRFGRWAHLTYSSYMLHMPVATFVVTVAGRFLAPHWLAGRFLLVAAAMAILVLASVASYRLFEEPLRRRLNAAFDRRRPAPAGAFVPSARSVR